MNWLTEGFQDIDLVLKNPNYKTTLSLHQNTAEFDYFIARGELERNGDLLCGMSHLAQLLTYDPMYPEWLELLSKYFSRAAENPESLLSEECRNYYAIEAVRAYIYAQQGKFRAALEILDAIAQSKPDALYMETWGIEWLLKPGVVESLDTRFIGSILASALHRFGEYRNITYTRQQYLLKYAELGKKLTALREREKNQDKQEDRIFKMILVGLLRKAGCFREALELAKTYHRLDPGWYSATAIGLILREMGHSETAERAFRQALKYDPQDMSARLEIGDMYFNLGNWQKAKKVYREVSKNSPQFSWAHSSILYCDWKLHPGQPYPESLLQMVSGEEPDYRASQFVKQFYPYTGYLPEPSDALANGLRQILDRDGDFTGDVKFTVSCLESPSNELAFKLAFGEKLNLVVAVENIPEPDPRLAIEPVAYKLWSYTDTKATPAVASPRIKVTATIAKIAAKPWKISQLWAASSRTAKQLKNVDIQEIMAVIVYPAPVPEGFTPLSWLPRLQLATAFVIAHYDTGWLDSQRRDALYSLLLGTRDWTTTAAVVALACLAEEYPVLSSDIAAAFGKLARARPNRGGCSHEYALYYNWLRLPHLFDEEREELKQILEAIDND